MEAYRGGKPPPLVLTEEYMYSLTMTNVENCNLSISKAFLKFP